MPWSQAHFPRKILGAAQNLSVDLATAEVAGALGDAGIRSILLKGPTFASLLYRDGELRTYVDVDLLIAQADASRAAQVLVQHGFSAGFESGDGARPSDRVLWIRPPDEVDLHHTLQGLEAEPEHVWSVLSATTDLQEVGGRQVEILSEAARAMHAALHAAQHGRRWDVPMEDLRRAIDILPFETWQEAARLAEQLEAKAAFVTGLRLQPEGVHVAERLGIASDGSVETYLRAQSPAHLTLGFEKLRSLEGPIAKARFMGRKIVPPAANMRFMMPLARRGRLGLAAAYLVRLGWVARHAGGGFRSWRQARREVDGPRNGIASIRAGWWAFLALRRARMQLSREGLDAVRLKQPPALPPEAEKGVRVVLKYKRHTCLVGAAVRQEWFVSQGLHRDIVIGVTAPKEDFQAHAWLDGDPPCHSDGFAELLRHPHRTFTREPGGVA